MLIALVRSVFEEDGKHCTRDFSDEGLFEV